MHTQCTIISVAIIYIPTIFYLIICICDLSSFYQIVSLLGKEGSYPTLKQCPAYYGCISN